MRVLLVEDDSRIAHFVAKGLREQSYAVDVVGSGEDALYQAAINTYDLVLLDVMIPAPDGFAVCRELRNNGQRMPILMLTARDAVEDRIEGLDRGADDYLTKPFEFRELLARMRALLRRPTSLQSARLVVADLIVDTVGQTVSRGGQTITMTAKEFDPFSNLIEVYVNRVRRKIDAGAAKPLLHTRRGAGYVLSLNETPAEAKPTAARNRNNA